MGASDDKKFSKLYDGDEMRLSRTDQNAKCKREFWADIDVSCVLHVLGVKTGQGAIAEKAFLTIKTI